MILASENSIGFKEAILLTFGLVLLLITCHYYFGVIGLVGAFSAGILVLFLPLAQSIKGAFLLVYFISSIFILDTYEGIQPIEIPFYGLSILLLLFIAYKFLTGSLKLENSLDYVFLVLHLLIPYAVVLGKLNGASTYIAFGEVVYFLGLFTYFPLREYLEHKRFKQFLGGILILILGFVLIRNFFYYREILLQALLPWQAEHARVAANELIVVAGCSFTLALATVSNSKWLQYLSTGLFVTFLISLILTQSRGYWFAGFFSFLAIFFIVERSGKIRILSTAIVLLSLGFIVANIIFDDLFSLIINALSDRFKSIGTANTDNSLQDRWLESKTVFGHVVDNPIAGYGFGVNFTRKVLFYDFFISTSYVHNGYLASLYKLGVLGFTGIIFIWINIFIKGKNLYRKVTNDYVSIIALTCAGVIFGMFFVNMTSPQILTFEGILFMTLATSYLNTTSANE